MHDHCDLWLRIIMHITVVQAKYTAAGKMGKHVPLSVNKSLLQNKRHTGGLKMTVHAHLWAMLS